MSIEAIMKAVDSNKEEIIQFARELVKTPSPTGEEGVVASLLVEKMRASGFSKVFTDDVGNVVGVIQGSGRGTSFLCNGHMDHVPPGEMKEPYSAKIVSGAPFGVEGEVIYGRGICDMKGALAAMVMAGHAILDLDLPLKGDFMATGTVAEEELGNVGPPALLNMDLLCPDAALIGECTDLQLAHGNRGVVRTKLTTWGKSCHVSVQERGVNALYKMANVIERIEATNSTLPFHPILGRSSWAVCKMTVVPNVVNVVPERCEAEIDTRNTPEFTPQMIMAEQKKILIQLSREDPHFKGEVKPIEKETVTWKGHRAKVRPTAPPFYIEPDHWLVRAGLKCIERVMKKKAKLKIWGFTTESYCFADEKIPTIGIGPGQERFAHCSSEVLPIKDLIAATKIYAILATHVCNLERLDEFQNQTRARIRRRKLESKKRLVKCNSVGNS